MIHMQVVIGFAYSNEQVVRDYISTFSEHVFEANVIIDENRLQ